MTLAAVLSGRRDRNIRFQDLRQLLAALGFDERVRGDHFIFSREGVEEIINLQPEGRQRETLPGEAGSPDHDEPWIGTGLMLKYEVIIYWSEDDQAFIAEVPELPGCMADGASKTEALAQVEQVAEQWIETARELGRVIPAPKGRLTFA